MADSKTPFTRSQNMSRIHSKDTKPEIIVRKYLFSKGFRYRKNYSKLPGKPDIVLRKYKTVIFIHGCFWHMHNCKRFRMPQSNTEYWQQKITRNVQRDIRVKEKLELVGWKVITIWECELKPICASQTLFELENKIKNNQQI